MSNLNTHGVNSYAVADRFLGTHRSRATLCFATTLTRETVRRPGVDSSHLAIVVRHHESPIIRYYADGEIWISNAGWLSATTTDRLHKMTPDTVRVSRAKGGSVTSPLFTADHQPHYFTRVV